MTDKFNRISSPVSPVEDAMLDRYWAGECDAPERELVRQWFELQPENQKLTNAVFAHVAQCNERPVIDSAAVIETLQRRLQPAALLAEGQPIRKLRTTLLAKAFIGAAGIVLLVGIGLFMISAHRSQETSAYTYATARGQRTTIFLGDGTRALLAPGSRLTYDDNASQRRVTLIGSAHFTVSSADAKPFIVRTPQAVTSVLGTEFTVRAYADDLEETILVRSGRVSVRSSAQPVTQAVVVAAAQQARIDVTRMTTITSVPHDAFVWTDGTLRFSSARVSDALREIGRWYDLDIRIDDPVLVSKHLNATFKQKSAEQVIQYLSVVLNARVQWDGRIVTFSR